MNDLKNCKGYRSLTLIHRVYSWNYLVSYLKPQKSALRNQSHQLHHIYQSQHIGSVKLRQFFVSMRKPSAHWHSASHCDSSWTCFVWGYLQIWHCLWIIPTQFQFYNVEIYIAVIMLSASHIYTPTVIWMIKAALCNSRTWFKQRRERNVKCLLR